MRKLQVDGPRVVRTCYWNVAPWLWLVRWKAPPTPPVESVPAKLPVFIYSSSLWGLENCNLTGVARQMSFFTYLDRSNLSFAAFQFKADMGLSNSIYGLRRSDQQAVYLYC